MKHLILFLFCACLSVQAFSQSPEKAHFGSESTPTILENSSGAPIVLTIDQTGGVGPISGASQQFSDFGDGQGQLADDFIIPAGPDLIIDNVDIIGVPFGPNPMGLNCSSGSTVRMDVYMDNGGLPGTLAFSESFDGPTVDPDNDGSFNLMSTTCPPLSPGTYWLSIVVEMPFVPCVQWGWTESSDEEGANASVWQNPDGIFGPICPTWEPASTCIGLTGPGLAFSMDLAEAPSIVPTLGEWAVICLGLIMMIFGIVAINQREIAVS